MVHGRKLSPPSEETKEWRDRNDKRADLAQDTIRATLKLFDLPVDPTEARRFQEFARGR